MKKTILILCLATILIATIGMVCASNDDYHEDVGVSYDVPKGYDFLGAFKAVGFMDILSNDEGVCFKYAKGNDNVSVTVFKVDSSTTNDDLKDALTFSGEEKTIGKNKGFLQDMSPNSVTFNYLKGGKYIYITAPDESVIEEMLK